MQWLLLSVKIQKMISVWWFANKVTYHIDAERNPTGSIVGRTSNNEERSYYKMEVSNNYSTAKLWGTSDKKVSKSSEKNKWKLTHFPYIRCPVHLFLPDQQSSLLKNLLISICFFQKV